jgi:hypothetical protein
VAHDSEPPDYINGVEFIEQLRGATLKINYFFDFLQHSAYK